jgi:hypothetical protein
MSLTLMACLLPHHYCFFGVSVEQGAPKASPASAKRSEGIWIPVRSPPQLCPGGC